jgi:predicted ester cyclase
LVTSLGEHFVVFLSTPVVFLSFVHTGFLEMKPFTERSDSISTEENKALIRRFYEEFNKKNLVALDDIIDLNAVDHSAPPGQPGGIEGARQFAGMILTAFPDLHFTVEDMIAEGDKVVARVTFRGTHQGTFMSFSPTGKHVTSTGIEINRIAGGKVVEHWNNYDDLGLLQQLGVVPSMG